MHKYLLTLSYNGTQYSGWQKQSKNKNTIQEICQNAVKKILVGDFHLGGASRTDKGVHADDQKILLKYKKTCSCRVFYWKYIFLKRELIY